MEQGKPRYADLYWGILARNYLNPLADPLYLQYYKGVPDQQKRTFGAILDSIHRIDQILGRQPGTAELYTARGKLFYLINENAAAESDLRRSLQYNSSHPDALYNLAFSEFHNNNIQRSLLHLQRYEKVIREKQLEPYEGFVPFKNTLVQLARIDSLLANGYERNPLLLKRARLFMEAGEYMHSLKDLEEVMKTENTNPTLFALRAYAHKKAGHDSAAIADLRSAERLAGKKMPDLEKELTGR